ncbi:MAG: hypothetical protein ACOVMQ_00785 [Cyclobacteriaceae bacterium]
MLALKQHGLNCCFDKLCLVLTISSKKGNFTAHLLFHAMKNNLSIGLIFIIAMSCNKPIEPTESSAIIYSSAPVTDQKEIIDKAYSSTRTYPLGFVNEQDPGGPAYYENTVSINSQSNVWIELSTGSYQQAKEWSDNGSSDRVIVAERETKKYYEFKRVSPTDANSVLFSRVHKATYFVPTIDWLNPSTSLGQFKVSLINKATVKEFIEYMWSTSNFSAFNKVLEYHITDDANKVNYNLKTVTLIGGDFGICDAIQVKTYDFFIDKRSGDITFGFKTVAELKGTCH